ncbi:MAG: F0F1 ATP synthase subunit A, partial [Acinetobacter baumannii]
MFYNPRSVVAGLLPMGAPAPLNPFLVIIETVRILVRPITLSVRLTANIRAG